MADRESIHPSEGQNTIEQIDEIKPYFDFYPKDLHASHLSQDIFDGKFSDGRRGEITMFGGIPYISESGAKAIHDLYFEKTNSNGKVQIQLRDLNQISLTDMVNTYKNGYTLSKDKLHQTNNSKLPVFDILLAIDEYFRRKIEYFYKKNRKYLADNGVVLNEANGDYIDDIQNFIEYKNPEFYNTLATPMDIYSGIDGIIAIDDVYFGIDVTANTDKEIFSRKQSKRNIDLVIDMSEEGLGSFVDERFQNNSEYRNKVRQDGNYNELIRTYAQEIFSKWDNQFGEAYYQAILKTLIRNKDILRIPPLE